MVTAVCRVLESSLDVSQTVRGGNCPRISANVRFVLLLCAAAMSAWKTNFDQGSFVFTLIISVWLIMHTFSSHFNGFKKYIYIFFFWGVYGGGERGKGGGGGWEKVEREEGKGRPDLWDRRVDHPRCMTSLLGFPRTVFFVFCFGPFPPLTNPLSACKYSRASFPHRLLSHGNFLMTSPKHMSLVCWWKYSVRRPFQLSTSVLCSCLHSFFSIFF